MKHSKSFSSSLYDDEMHLAECELSAFINSVAALYGPEQSRLSAEDWLDELEHMDNSARSEARNWRAVTIAASARLANRLKIKPGRGVARRCDS